MEVKAPLSSVTASASAGEKIRSAKRPAALSDMRPLGMRIPPREAPASLATDCTPPVPEGSVDSQLQ